MEILIFALDIIATWLYGVLGGFLWAWAEFSNAKNKAERNNEPFSFSAYKSQNYEEWIGIAGVTLFLILVGYLGFGVELLSVLDPENVLPEYSTAWYGLAGIVWHLIKYSVQWLDKKFNVNS